MEYNPTIEVSNEKTNKQKLHYEILEEAVSLVTEQGYSMPKAAAYLGITDKLLYSRKAKLNVERAELFIVF